MKGNVRLNEDISINGDRFLILSIFRNLLENSINYAGENCKTFIQIYREDNVFYYFSLPDNQVGNHKKQKRRRY
ncbi:MAG: hypothetical protein JEY96_11020 [Bacteroidales bacterium]|nr:hypothetical protein [Bacteroidales bacterium]